MKYSPTERKELAEVFRQAQYYLWKGPGDSRSEVKHFICFAISATIAPGWVKGLARDVVMKRLGNQGTLEWWLYKRQYITHPGANYDNKTRRAIQKHRLMWLKELEREFSQ